MAQVSQILLCQNKFYRGWPQLATHSTQGTTTNALVPDTEGHPQDFSPSLEQVRAKSIQCGASMDLTCSGTTHGYTN